MNSNLAVMGIDDLQPDDGNPLGMARTFDAEWQCAFGTSVRVIAAAGNRTPSQFREVARHDDEALRVMLEMASNMRLTIATLETLAHRVEQRVTDALADPYQTLIQ